jgi:hypothetical protein
MGVDFQTDNVILTIFNTIPQETVYTIIVSSV